MQLHPGQGLGEIVFGSQQADIVSMLGEPDKIFTDEDDDDELIYQYNKLKLRLSFYMTEEGKLGYIRTASPEANFNGEKLIGRPVQEVIDTTFSDLPGWEEENYDFFDTYLNGENWIVLNSSYDEVTDIEIGVPYNEDDNTYDWP